jgi:large subunit ribosomal protein L11
MADKKVTAEVKLVIGAGQAKPVPPVGSTLGPYGLNLMQFCKEFNDKTQDKKGEVVPVVINVYEDRSFDFIMKVAPAGELIKKALGLKSGAANPLKDKVGTLTRKQLEEIAIKKMPDMNTKNLEAAMRTIAGSARQMGVKVEL